MYSPRIDETVAESLLQAAERALQAVIFRAPLEDAECLRWPWGEPGIPVMTLAWMGVDGIGRNIHVALYLEAWEPFVIVEANAWSDVEEGESRMRNEEIGRIEGIRSLPLYRFETDINRLVERAFDSVSRRQAGELTKLLSPTSAASAARRSDPGPLTTASYLGE
jgi:hypothetical protein